MFRYKDSKYGEYKTESEAHQLFLDLPEDIDMIRQIFEDSFKNQPEEMMFDRLVENEKYKDIESNEDKYFVKIGWHTPFELFFQATSMQPDMEKMRDRARYKSIIGSILSAKHGTPISFKFTKLVQVAQNVIEYYPEFYSIFKSVCYYYDTLDLLKEQDKNGKLTSKEKEYASKINSTDYTLNNIIEFLCPKLNGRLTYRERFVEKASLEEVLDSLFSPVKLFSVLFNSSKDESNIGYLKEHNAESFTLIKHYLKSRCYDNDPMYSSKGLSYLLNSTSLETASEIEFFLNSIYKPDYLGLSVRDGTTLYEKELKKFVTLVHLFDLSDYISEGYYEDKNGCCFYLTCKYEGLDENQVLLVKYSIIDALNETISEYELS